MNVRVIEEEGRTSLEVRVFCAPGDARVERIRHCLRLASGKLVGYPSPGSPGKRIVPLDDLLYVETKGGPALLHLADGTVLESPLRLFELEGALVDAEFVRTSRQAIVNFGRVVSIRPELNGRLVLGLEGGERLLVTRSYAKSIKQMIGISTRRESS